MKFHFINTWVSLENFDFWNASNKESIKRCHRINTFLGQKQMVNIFKAIICHVGSYGALVL